MQTTPSATPRWSTQRIVLTTLGAVCVGLGFWLLLRFYHVLFILFAALVLSTAIRSPVEWLYRLKLPRATGVILVYLVLIALLTGFILLLLPLLVEQTRALIDEIPTYYQNLRAWLTSSGSALLQRLALQLPVEPTFGLAPQAGGSLPLSSLGQALGYVGALWKVLFIGTAILVLAFYWTLDGERTIRTVLLRGPVERREAWRNLIAEMETKVGAYIRGVALLSLAVGVMATVAYLLIGVPSALVLGLLAGVFEAVPVIGPVLAAIPPLLLVLSSDPDKAIWVAVASIVIQQAENNFLVPRVMDKAVGVSPVVTILAISAFSTLFGLPGAILSIPLAALVQIVLDHLVRQREAMNLEQPEGRSRASALRYQVQELVQDVRQQVRHKEDASDEEGDDIEDLVEVAALTLDRILAQAVPEEGP